MNLNVPGLQVCGRATVGAASFKAARSAAAYRAVDHSLPGNAILGDKRVMRSRFTIAQQ